MKFQVRQFRKSKKMSQSDFAAILGVSTSCYQMKEAGGRGFSLKDAYKLSEHFGVSIETIFGTPDAMKNQNQSIYDSQKFKEAVRAEIEQFHKEHYPDKVEAFYVASERVRMESKWKSLAEKAPQKVAGDIP